MSLLEKNNGLDKVSSTTIRRQYTDVSKIVHAASKPIEVTVNGKADMVIMKPELFDALMDLLEDYEDHLAILDYESSKDPKQWQTADEVLKDTEAGPYRELSIEELLSQ